MVNKTRWTPGPWKAGRWNWLGEDSGHRIYVHGNEHEDYDEDEDADPEGDSCRLVATGVAIVEGNATSRQVTEANARLIVAAPAMAEAIRKMLACLESYGPAINGLFGHDEEFDIEGMRAALSLAEGG